MGEIFHSISESDPSRKPTDIAFNQKQIDKAIDDNIKLIGSGKNLYFLYDDDTDGFNVTIARARRAGKASTEEFNIVTVDDNAFAYEHDEKLDKSIEYIAIPRKRKHRK